MFPPQLKRGFTLAWQTGQIPAKQGVCLFPTDYKDSPARPARSARSGKKKVQACRHWRTRSPTSISWDTMCQQLNRFFSSLIFLAISFATFVWFSDLVLSYRQVWFSSGGLQTLAECHLERPSETSLLDFAFWDLHLILILFNLSKQSDCLDHWPTPTISIHLGWS